MKALELCPCCGDYAFLMNDTDSIRNYYGLPCWYVQCLNCGLRTKKGEMDEVINNWNTRNGYNRPYEPYDPGEEDE